MINFSNSCYIYLFFFRYNRTRQLEVLLNIYNNIGNDRETFSSSSGKSLAPFPLDGEVEFFDLLVVDDDVLPEHVRDGQVVRVNYGPVQRVAHGASVDDERSSDRAIDVVARSLVEDVHGYEELERHALLLTLGENQTVRETGQSLDVSELLVGVEGLLDLLEEQMSGYVVGNAMLRVVVVVLNLVDAGHNCNI